MADLQQILAGTSLTITETFEVDGTATDTTGLPTIDLFKPDGTAYTPEPTVSDTWPDRTTGQYRFVLPAQENPYKLRYQLVGTIGAQVQTLQGWVEWVGASLFNLSAFRGLRVANSTPFAANAVPFFTDRQIRDERTAVLDELTDALGFPPVPRYAIETIDVADGYQVILAGHMEPQLLSVKVAGTAGVLSSYNLSSSGVLRPISGYLPGSGIPYGVANLTVEYTHGWNRPRGKCSDFAMLLAAKYLNPSGFSTATTVSTPDGVTYSYEPSETGRGGHVRPTGFRDIDRWIMLHQATVPA